MCKRLFHYTCWNGFEGILEKKGLLLNCVTNVKDNEEVDNVVKVIRESLKKNPTKEKEFLNALGQGGKSLEKTISDIRNATYTTCFSKESDNDYLWENYAHKYHGLEMEFTDICQNYAWPAYSFIGQQAATKTNGGPWQLTNLSYTQLIEMSYNDKAMHQTIKNVLSGTISGMNFLHAIASYHKDKKYKKEQEIRLGFFPINAKGKIVPVGSIPPNQIFHYANNRETIYYPVLTCDNNCKLKAIKIGKNSKLSKTCVQQLLKKHGFDKKLINVIKG
jgi:hypothetical protein